MEHRRVVALLVGVLGGTLVFAGSASALPFLEATAQLGLDFVHAPLHDRLIAFQESTAGGLCWGDYDGDGRVDLYVTDTTGPDNEGRSRLYRNMGPGPAGVWRFEDVTEPAGVGLLGVGQACIWGDHDNDGRLDLLVTMAITEWSAQGNVLFRNVDGTRFEDVTEAAGLHEAALPSGSRCEGRRTDDQGDEIGMCWSTGAAWIDIDLDGDLDLYVAQYAEFGVGTCVQQYRASPVFCMGQPNRLYRNDGRGRFRDIALDAGVAFNGQPTRGRSLGVVATDIDGDSWPDLYVANDKDANALYLNNRDGTFRSVASELGVDNFGPLTDDEPEHRAGMGVAAVDFDDDGRIDLFSTHLRAEYDGVYHNTGSRWDDVALPGTAWESVARDTSRWGIGVHDFDMDGRKDVMIVAGGPSTAADGPVHLLFNKDTRFQAPTTAGWPHVQTNRTNHRGAAFADFDDDGDIDAAINVLGRWDREPAPLRLFENQAVRRGANGTTVGHVRLEVQALQGAGPVVGAAITVTPQGGGAQHFWTVSGGSHLSDDDKRIVVAIGEARAGEVHVVWPGGATTTTTFDVASGGRVVTLVEPGGRAEPPPTGPEVIETPGWPVLAVLGTLALVAWRRRS